MSTTLPIIITPKQIAAARQVTVAAVYFMIRRGRLPAMDTHGRRVNGWLPETIEAHDSGLYRYLVRWFERQAQQADQQQAG
jgi:hypothetical protein